MRGLGLYQSKGAIAAVPADLAVLVCKRRTITKDVARGILAGGGDEVMHAALTVLAERCGRRGPVAGE